MPEHDLAALSDPGKDQYFLTNPAKLQYIIDAADIRDTDTVVEIGAGAGTVARILPRCASLTLVELDERLIPALQTNAPDYASIVEADGLELLRKGNLNADVILANLPSSVAGELAELLPTLTFRVAVIAAGSAKLFAGRHHELSCSVLTEMRGTDFTPPQPGTSYLTVVRRLAPNC